MMNGRVMRAVLVRNQDANGVVNDEVPKSVQFDESSEHYRCLCNCFHIKTGALIVAGAELLMLLIFFINSLLIIAEQDTRFERITGMRDNEVVGPFAASMIGIGLSFLAVILLLIGIIRSIAAFLIPHLIIQIIVMVLLVFALACGFIAFSTNTTVFYRLMNAASFKEHPGAVTVDLDAHTSARFVTVFILYLVCLALQCWFVVIVYNCYRYLEERCRYMHYCLAFSTPMKTLSSR
ncbi:unnamed protein product [Gongylonema pulchrum]|uniref:Uncharacterized protein n=1 Tax=Gongylonema pulchrum TaxID=637853 RepID=A0A183CV01_9BILA|nr:unnamed protein product [Gongylonema pulchrum]